MVDLDEQHIKLHYSKILEIYVNLFKQILWLHSKRDNVSFSNFTRPMNEVGIYVEFTIFS